MWLGRRLVRLQPGDFTLTPARLKSNYDLDEAGHHLCIHFETLAARRFPLRLPLHWRPGPHAQWLGERLQEIIHLFRLGDGTSREAKLARHAAGAALQGMLLWLAVTVGPRQTAAVAAPTRVDGALDDVRRHLDEHYRRPLDVPALARQVGVSQNHLARRFRARHGMTLQRYVLGRRIELARHLLAATRLPLKAVAIEAGLGNPQYFHRQFQRATGHNPSEERRLSVARGS
ncbi:MAG: putative AraC family transcriptional regulator [Verrucomicrobia bacterium]|nr:putative AraC family transcriptional regulator [Verrucomicrobiota bacterium]